ncbi:hypothetical protein FB567DRAFT_569751 [Paraphoma chrysanthemicola]|uniref:Uncharacterized protein n=1 Tax=Paraphoma chrysanthemicola TaxID=798071 RepID=A0A8K0R925_9PLEO|nr:hypothetical protein FB567DRAFT_569751 [Paraphoma chrysanthemicola]
MSSFAPPVRRGDFLYSTVFQADPGNSNPHPRASLAELPALLFPDTSKSGKSAPSSPAKDHPWHFWAAQLLHYGLPMTRDKNRAKMRLLDAMNQGRLEVPGWVSKLEAELKKEWEAENKKMKKKTAGAGATSSKNAMGKSYHGEGNVTGTQSAGVNVTGNIVNLSVSSGYSMAGPGVLQQTSQSSPKKPTPAKRKRVDNNTPPLASTPKKTTKNNTATSPTPSKRSKKEPTPRVKKEPSHSSTTASPFRPRIKQERYIKPDPYADLPSSPNTQQCALLSGTYTISCPLATALFSTSSSFSLTLAKDPSRSVWWASTSMGSWDFLIQLNPGPTHTVLGEPCTLGWRMRDMDTGELKFGKGCMGEMVFGGNGKMSACLWDVPGVGEVELEGWREDGDAVEGDWREEWDGFVREAYGR